MPLAVYAGGVILSKYERSIDMKHGLTRLTVGVWHFRDGQRVEGLPPDLWGCISPGLSGCVTGLTGCVTGLWGCISPGLSGCVSPGLSGCISPGLSGCISGILGNGTGVLGSVDDCELTEEERAAGVDIAALVVPAAV